jgi:hypothetical protein
LSDQTKFSTAEDVREELALDPKRALMFMGAQYVEGGKDDGQQHIHIIFAKNLLESLNYAGKACVLEALQKAAEFVAASMVSGPGASKVA